MCVFTSSGVNLREGGCVPSNVWVEDGQSLYPYFNPTHLTKKNASPHNYIHQIRSQYDENAPDSRGANERRWKKSERGKER